MALRCPEKWSASLLFIEGTCAFNCRCFESQSPIPEVNKMLCCKAHERHVLHLYRLTCCFFKVIYVGVISLELNYLILLKSASLKTLFWPAPGCQNQFLILKWWSWALPLNTSKDKEQEDDVSRTQLNHKLNRTHKKNPHHHCHTRLPHLPVTGFYHQHGVPRLTQLVQLRLRHRIITI